MIKKTLSILFVCGFLTTSLFAKDVLNGAGASFPFPVYSAWAYLYNKAEKIRVNYQSIGSGGGVRQISNRTVHFGASDAPLDQAAQMKGKLFQFPAIIGGVVPVINVRGIKSGQLKLTPDLMVGIFLGKINMWNDPHIQHRNPGLKLPNKKINVVHRADGSGTTAIFTTYMAKVSDEWATKVGKGKAVKWPVGIGGKGNEGVAGYVKRLKNSIGYVEFAYAKTNKLTAVQIQNKSGKFVDPSFDSFKEAASFAEWNADQGFYLWLVDAPGEKSWPIAGASFILLAKEKGDVNKRVTTFFDWTFKNGDKTAEKLTYVPLPITLKDKVRAYWKQNGIH